MSDATGQPRGRWASPEMQARLRRRRAAERRFRLWGLLALCAAGLALCVLLGSVGVSAVGAFGQAQLRLEVRYDPELLGVEEGLSGDARRQALRRADHAAVLREALRARFPSAASRREVRELQGLLSAGAREVLRARLLDDPGLLGTAEEIWVPADDEVEGWLRRGAPEAAGGRLGERQVSWLAELDARGDLRRVFHTGFFTRGDSREPELAGIGGALVGSLLTLVVTLAVAFPLGVAAAIHLEEFAPRNRWTDLVEININNLAAVPSIVFGLLGLAVFLNVMQLPRSAPLVGGLTLALMTLPVIIIAARNAIQAVPPSIREAARGLGASRVQVALHHVLPLALPGILTGTIIGLSRALGETAPLLMIGMVAFVVDVPGGFADAATALPVQIFLWADSPERAFVEKVSGAILVLLGFLVVMNGAAIWLRQRSERQW